MAFDPTHQQADILRHNLQRHARVLAGPGTGKSATLIALLNGVPADRPLRTKLLTFTRAATAELVQKLAEVENPACERPSTLHSFCIAVLLANEGLGEFPRPFRMADDWENNEIVQPTLARRLQTGKRMVTALLRELASNWESLDPRETAEVDPALRARFQGAWRQHREIYGYTLPAELPYALLMALRDHPDLGVDHDVLVVDEYQDLNACDLGVLIQLAGRGCTIIAAGDDDQSIYSFRKAHPEGIRRFLEDYANADDYPLSVTLRCGKKLVEWANYVIQGDPDRPVARPRLQAAVGAPDGDIALLSFAGEVSEARGIARLVHWLVTRKGVAAPEILILMRSDHHNQFSKRIKEELQRSRIEFSDPESINRVLNDETTRKALSLFRLAINREDSLAWATLLHIAPGIGDAVFDHVYEEARDTRGTFGGTLIVQSQNDLPGVARAPATRTISLVRDAIRWIETHPVPEAKPEQGWAEWILESLGGVTAPVSPEFRALLVTVDQLIEPTDELERYLSQIGPVARDNALAKGAGVRIMTMASSKGLTVEAAIVCGLETGLIPMDGRDLAEERRLLYVAMTRAKKYLFGTWAQQRGGPTARAGRGQVRQRRRSSTFLEGGPVRSQDGTRYLNNLDGGAAQA